MEIFCPNCKRSADLHTVDSVDFIECPECGWFQVQEDMSMTPCDEPVSKVDRSPEPGQIEEPADPEPAEPDPAADPFEIDPPADPAKPEPSLQEPASTSVDDIPVATAPSDKPALDEDDEDEINVRVTFED